MSRYKLNENSILRKPYVIYVLALVLLTLFVWIYLWSGLASYEKAVPKNIMGSMIEDIEKQGESGSCEAVLKKYHYSSQFFTTEESGRALADLVAGKELSFKKLSTHTTEGEVAYTINAGDDPVASCILKQRERGGIFGMAMYDVLRLEGTGTIDVMAQPGAKLYIMGKEVDMSAPTEENVVLPELKALSEFPSNKTPVPTYNKYTVGGLFGQPDITAQLEDGTDAAAVFMKDGTVLIGKAASDDLKAEITERITTITQLYSYYMSDDLGWGGFKGYLVKWAPVYDRLRTLEVYWYTNHDSTRFENMNVDKLFMYSDSLLSLNMTYDYVVVGQGKVTTYDTDLTYYLAKDTDGKWRVAEMIVN